MQMDRVLVDVLACLARSRPSLYASQTPDQLADIVCAHLVEFRSTGDFRGLKPLHALFLPTASLQEIALDNDWGAVYLELAQAFEQALAQSVNNEQ